MTHPQELLPWYANRTLSDAERADVAAHLEGCAACRAELEELCAMQGELREAMRSGESPSPVARRRVLAAIRTSRDAETEATPEPALARLAAGIQALFELRWVPAAALALIALQGGLLFWTMQHTAPEPQVRTRALAAPSARMRVRFAPDAREEAIRALLLELRGRVVDGPDRDGGYVIEVLASDASRAAVKLARLRERPDVVAQAEMLEP